MRLLSIILRIVENEISFNNGFEIGVMTNWIIKLIITVTTIILVDLVFYYHSKFYSLFYE